MVNTSVVSRRDQSRAISTKSTRKGPWAPTICLEGTKHSVVGRAASQCDMAAAQDESSSTVIWMDGVVSITKLLSLQPWQRINHFPGMHHICHKDYLARNLGKMRSRFRSEYSFWPKTWCMKTDAIDFINHAKKPRSSGNERWFIAKPDSKSRGIGIYVFSKPEHFVDHPEFDMVVQQYVDKPLLIEGYKFDMRIYALVTSCDPFRIFVYKEGLARFATEPYGEGPLESNRENTCMHLTNYSINKKSSKFVDGGPTGGSKRTLSWALAYLDSLGHDGNGAVWTSIKDIIVKSLITVNPELSRVFRSCFPGNQRSVCFEVLGFDILLDAKLRPYVLEINHSPSLSCDTSVDRTLKEGLLINTFKLLNLESLNPKSWASTNRRESQRRLYSGTQDVGEATTMPRVSSRVGSASESKRSRSPPIAFEEMQPACGEPLLPASPTVRSSKPLANSSETLTDLEDLQIGQFERLYPSPDPKLAAKYEILMNVANELFMVPETATTKARKAHSLAQLNVADAKATAMYNCRVPQKSISLATLPLSAASSTSSLSKAELAAHVDSQISNYLDRKKKLQRSRTSLPVNVSTFGGLQPLEGSGGVVNQLGINNRGASSVHSRSGGVLAFPTLHWRGGN